MFQIFRIIKFACQHQDFISKILNVIKLIGDENLVGAYKEFDNIVTDIGKQLFPNYDEISTENINVNNNNKQ